MIGTNLTMYHLMHTYYYNTIGNKVCCYCILCIQSDNLIVQNCLRCDSIHFWSLSENEWYFGERRGLGLM